jgi:hypothetical protein
VAWEVPPGKFAIEERYFVFASPFATRLVWHVMNNAPLRFVEIMRTNEALFGLLFEEWCHDQVRRVNQSLMALNLRTRKIEQMDLKHDSMRWFDELPELRYPQSSVRQTSESVLWGD